MRIAIEALVGDLAILRRAHLFEPGTRFILAPRALGHLRQANQPPLFADVGLIVERLDQMVTTRFQRRLEVGMCDPILERAHGNSAILGNLFLRQTALKDETEHLLLGIGPLQRASLALFGFGGFAGHRRSPRIFLRFLIGSVGVWLAHMPPIIELPAIGKQRQLSRCATQVSKNAAWLTMTPGSRLWDERRPERDGATLYHLLWHAKHDGRMRRGC